MLGRRRVFSLCLGLLACTSAVSAATPDEIDQAIRKGIDFLYSRPEFQQHGNWEFEQKRLEKGDGDSVTGPQWGGRTALITYALLASGESPNDPRLKRAIDFLKSSDDMIGYYAIGVRPHIWMYLPTSDEVRSLALRDFKLLWAGIEKDMKKKDGGLYDYTLAYDRERVDMSASQYGVMGMWACAQLGIEVPSGDPRKNQPNFWAWTDTAWRKQHDKTSGGWAYGTSNTKPNAAMTAAGVATLMMVQDHRSSDSSVNCTGNYDDPTIQKGITFLESEIPKLFSDESYPDRLYSAYAIERVSLIGGLKYLNKLDWYATGSDWLIKMQARNGSWTGGRGGVDVSTAFALLFLSRGREPVMMNKLKYDIVAKTGSEPIEGFWNQRSRDVANAARYISRQTERGLNWQIIDMKVARIADLRDAPIAYISGSQQLRFSKEQLDLLKQYVEEGGMLVFNPDCTRPQFSRSIAPLLKEIFPGSEFRPLPDSHVIYRNQQFKSDKWKKRPSVQGLSNGVRELALIFDEDLGKSFQINETTRTPQHFELVTNLYQYAIDKSHSLVKGRSWVVEADASVQTTSNIKLARLEHGSGWNPEPGGWRRLAAVLRNTHKVDLQTNVVHVETGDLVGYHAAHLTGTRPIKLSEAAVKNLRQFVEAGGLLIIDAAGGSTEFAASIEPQLGSILASAKDAGGPLIAPGDPIFTSGGLEAPEFRYRTYAQTTVGLSTTPKLHGAKQGERYGMVYSAEDLSAGLVGNEVDGIRGYTPSTATQIMVRLLRYAQDAPSGKAATRPSQSPASAPTTVPAKPASATRPTTRPARPAAGSR